MNSTGPVSRWAPNRSSASWRCHETLEGLDSAPGRRGVAGHRVLAAGSAPAGRDPPEPGSDRLAGGGVRLPDRPGGQQLALAAAGSAARLPGFLAELPA